MKNILYLVLFLTSLTTNAQSGLHYQGVLRNAEGALLADASIDLRFRLMRDTTSPGAFDYEEIHERISTNHFGVFSTALGRDNPDTLQVLDFTTPYFIEVSLQEINQSIFTPLHRSSLAMVPYAIHALTVENTDDADADPLNEMQSLSFDSVNNILQISGGNAIQMPIGISDADADPENEIQALTKVGNKIRLSNGGEVIDAIEDEDADPKNELQTLSKEGNTIKLSSGGEVTDQVVDGDADSMNEIQTISLSASKIELSKNGGEISLSNFSSPWKDGNGQSIYFDHGVGIGIANPAFELEVDGFIKGDRILSTKFGHPSFSDKNKIELAGIDALDSRMYFDLAGERVFQLEGSLAQFNVVTEFEALAYLYQGFRADNNCTISDRLNIGDFEPSSVGKLNINGNLVGHNDSKLRYWHSASGATGLSIVYGNNNFWNAAMGSAQILNGTGGDNRGSVGVYDANQVIKAGMFVNSANEGIIFADQKNFRMDHPEDPDKEIWYASLEGPEVAAYDRGTGYLVNGEAAIPFSEHFQLVANLESTTIQLTPKSRSSQGIAIIKTDSEEFHVGELNNGDGTYEFFWEAKAVRKGHEDFKVIRKKFNQ